MNQLEPLKQLISRLARLPGVGRRSAERMAFRIATDQKGLARDLIQALEEVSERVMCCSQCGNLTLKTVNPCAICTDSRRESSMLCVVEHPSEIGQIESAGVFQGRYFCLMGKLSPMQGQDVASDKVAALRRRIREEGVKEVILALDTDVESDATASSLHETLSSEGVRVSRLAFGLPAGSGIAYSDPVTLARAVHGRQSF